MKMKKKSLIIISTVLLLALSIGVGVSASSSISIDNIFRQINEDLNKTNKVPDSTVIASGNGIMITSKDFRQYLANIKFMELTSGQDFQKSKQDLLKDMIKRELTVNYALSRGIKVSDEELKSYIEEQRKSLQSAPQEVKDILKNLVQKSGLTEEQYWNSHETMNLYRRWILINKLIEQLYSNGEIKTPEDFSKFQDSLLTSLQNSVTIDYINLNLIE